MTSPVRVVLASRGDALTPYLRAALARRFTVVADLDPELTLPQRLLVAATTVRPSRSAWAERFYKSERGRRLRSRNGRRRLAALGPDSHDVVVQVHALFDLGAAHTVLYVDCTHHQVTVGWPAWNPMGARAEQAWLARERDELHRAAHVATFSDDTTSDVLSHHDVPPERVSTVGAGANQHTLPVLGARPSPAAPTVLFIGNDFVRKGGDVLLTAFRDVRRRVPGARLVLVGTDPGVAPQDGVEVLGRVRDRGVVDALYAAATVVTVPSLFDPFPLVLLEAMAWGLPVVSTRSCGIPEIVVDEVTGYLVDPGDAVQLADRLVRLLTDPAAAQQLGAAGRRRVDTHFTWDAVVARMAPAITALVGAPPQK